jgi:hypothetical protein
VTISAALLAALGLALAVGVVSNRGWTHVVAVSVLERAGVIYVADLELFLVAAEPEPVALLARMPGVAGESEGERLRFCPIAQAFQGSGGEVFDRVGRVVQGGAPRGMDRVEVRITGGVVDVRPDSSISGPPREAASFPVMGELLCDPSGPEGPPGFLSPEP